MSDDGCGDDDDALTLASGPPPKHAWWCSSELLQRTTLWLWQTLVVCGRVWTELIMLKFDFASCWTGCDGMLWYWYTGNDIPSRYLYLEPEAGFNQGIWDTRRIRWPLSAHVCLADTKSQPCGGWEPVRWRHRPKAADCGRWWTNQITRQKHRQAVDTALLSTLWGAFCLHHTNLHKLTRAHTNSHELTRTHTNSHELTRTHTNHYDDYGCLGHSQRGWHKL